MEEVEWATIQSCAGKLGRAVILEGLQRRSYRWKVSAGKVNVGYLGRMPDENDA